MATTAIRGKACQTNAELPALEQQAPDFCVVNTKLKDVCLSQYNGKNKLIYVVTSLDTDFCADTTLQLNNIAQDLENTEVLVISADLPFALQRFCKDHKPKNLAVLSLMRSKQFAKDYGVLLVDGPLKGLCARALFVLDESNEIVYRELTSDLTSAPDFTAAIETLKSKAI